MELKRPLNTKLAKSAILQISYIELEISNNKGLLQFSCYFMSVTVFSRNVKMCGKRLKMFHQLSVLSFR